MAIEIVMPKIGLNMEEGVIIDWVKKEGDQVKRGDVLFVVETDKVTVDSEAQEEGVLARILVPEGQRVPVKTPVAIMTAEGETLDEAPAAEAPASAPQAEAQPAAPAPAAPAAPPAATQANGTILASPKARYYARQQGIDLAQMPTARQGVIKYQDVLDLAGGVSASPGRVQATPLAKRVAQAEGVDLAAVVGTGTAGRITRRDVEAALQGQASPPPSAASLPAPAEFTGVRAVIAERMHYSAQHTAPVTLHSEVDVTPLVEFRQARKAAGANLVPSYNAILVSLVAKALLAHPLMNASEQDGRISFNQQVNIGVAVDHEDGLRVVVVNQAHQKSVSQIEADLITLIERVQSNSSLPDDFAGATFTLTSLGAFGIDRFTPIINPPQVGILGVGRIAEKLVLLDGRVAQRSMMTLSLTFDHRVIDGAPSARFLQTVAQEIGDF